MSRGNIAVLIGALTLWLADGAAAQTTVTIFSNDAALAPLQILDTDYPFQSLLANEEGRTGLNLILDATRRVRTPQIISSSGHPLLDGKAAQIARIWSFQSAAQNPLSEVKVEVDWKLPEGSVVVSPEPLNSHAVQRIDYPTISIQSNEQGEVSLTFRIGEDGSTSDVQVVDSSGYGHLDRSAMRMVQRWKYSAGTVEAKCPNSGREAESLFF
jgi:TonB family protein